MNAATVIHLRVLPDSYRGVCYRWHGKRRIEKVVWIPATSKEKALERFQKEYASPRYVSHMITSIELDARSNKTALSSECT
jgi:hypothetical protein